MKKPTIYLDTNIFSAYWYEGEDVAAAARRFHTREWWDAERRHFSVRVSVTTINELRAGVFRRQSECLRMARALPRLAMTQKAKHVLDAGPSLACTAVGFTRDDPTSAVRTDHSKERIMNDVIVDEVRRVREELIDRYGGIDGYFKHCQSQERARVARSKGRRRKRPARTTQKRTTKP